MKNVQQIFKKNHFILSLLLFAFFVRIGYVFNNIIPFNFDHGKDSLAAMDLLVNANLKFIGPWTSIPGLYFGPAWYYLISPGLLLTNFNPSGPVFIMLVLVLVQIWLAYCYFGRFVALIVATAPFWLMLSKSAWNPFPMTLLSWLLIILMKEYKAKKKLPAYKYFFIGITASLGFHFSAAFAIFYPVIISLFCIKNKLIPPFKCIFFTIVGFLVPFIPQLLFELKNNFVQTKAVIIYFSVGEAHEFGIEKVLMVTRSYINELLYFITPNLGIDVLQKLFLPGIIILMLLILQKQKYIIIDVKNLDLVDLLICLLIPYIGFLFLHYNIWYVYALAPVMVLTMSEIIKKQNTVIQLLLIIIFMISPLVSYTNYVIRDRSTHAGSRNFLPAKEAAVDYVYQQADNKPFASYHFVPDIYDYTYQYIYLWKAQNGAMLPTEFSYKPGEIDYINEKPALLTKSLQYTGRPEKVFFIIESAAEGQLLDRWWGQQKYSSIISEHRISKDILVFEALP